MTLKTGLTRRSLLKGGVALGAAGLAAPYIARAAGYPERNIEVLIPTREGGGADRNFRAFSQVWSQKIGAEFEPGFFPGASGRVGYEVYMGKRDPDAYSLIFGNMGPEVLNWAIQEPSFDLNDYFYFGRVDTDPCVAFVGAESPMQSIEDIVAEGKKRTLTVGTSRMAHPASIGILALGEKTGASFNLIPLSGGKNTVAGAVTGEVDFSVLTSGTVISAGDAVKTVLVFGENRVGEQLDNAPEINDAYDMTCPRCCRRAPSPSTARLRRTIRTASRCCRTRSRRPSRIRRCSTPMSPRGGTPEYLNYGGVEECGAFADAMLELGARYKPLLTGA
jgi:putative tricarboxylic transport membrane protein